MICLICLRELVLKKPVVCVGVLFVNTSINSRFQLKECNGCHDLMQNNVAIVSVKETDYRIQVWYMNKDESMILLKNANLSK